MILPFPFGSAGVFTQTDAHDFVTLAATGTDAQIQFAISGLRVRFQARRTSPEDRKGFVYLLARLVKSFHFLSFYLEGFRRDCTIPVNSLFSGMWRIRGVGLRPGLMGPCAKGANKRSPESALFPV